MASILHLNLFINMKDSTEKELIEGCKANNRAFQSKLFKMYSGKMLGVCMRYAKDNDEADDMLQISFIKIFKKIKSFRNDDGSLEGWIRKIVVNSAIDEIRKNKRLKISSVSLEEVEDKDVTIEIEEEVYMSEIGPEKVISHMQKLPDCYRTVFNMYAFEGLTHQEISENLDIHIGTSKSNYHKAKKALKSSLTKELEVKA